MASDYGLRLIEKMLKDYTVTMPFSVLYLHIKHTRFINESVYTCMRQVISFESRNRNNAA